MCIDDTAFTFSEWWWPEGIVIRPNQYADFASDWVLEEIPAQASLAISCGSLFTLWVNGGWVCHGPAREVSPWQYYEIADIRPHLKTGINRIRIRAHHLGISHQSHESCAAGLLIAAKISGVTWDAANKSLWRARESRGMVSHDRRFNSCTGFSEEVDLNEDPESWLHADFSSLGTIPATVGRHPLLGRENLIANDAPLEEKDVCQARFLTKTGGWQVWDFGGEVFGFLGAELNADSPLSCPLIHGESLSEVGLPDYRFGGGDFREILHLPQGRRCWESFEKRALRYIALPENITVNRVWAREYGQPLREVWHDTPAANQLDPQEHAIVRAAARTIQICADDLLNDCPRRERAQYNDPTLYMEAFPLLFGTWTPYKRWLIQYLRGADADGILRACYPSAATNKFVIPDFSIAFAKNLNRYLDATGDIDLIRAAFPSALSGLRSYERHTDAQGLLCDVPGWVFLCNSFELAKTPRSSALNALWADAWRQLALLAQKLGDTRHSIFHAKSEEIRLAWRDCFWKEGLILDADSSPDHATRRWWNYHHEAAKGHFVNHHSEHSSFILRVRWNGAARTLWVASPGPVRIWCDGQILLDERPANPWIQSPIFHPWQCELPEGFTGGEIVCEVGYSAIDWEIYLSADAGVPDSVTVGEVATNEKMDFISLREIGIHPSVLRLWTTPRYNQITVGYAVSCGMLTNSEAVPVLRDCLREEYAVPWLKRTTPIICRPTCDMRAIEERAVLCNTPNSLFFFCQALEQHGMRAEARALCKKLFGAMIERGSDTLWEEFAPRSSLCHAWGAMCVPYFLS